MEIEDSVKFCDSSYSGHGSEIEDPRESGSEAIKSDILPLDSQGIDENSGEAPQTTGIWMNESMKAFPVNIELMESVISAHTENGSLAVHSENGFGNLGKDATLTSKRQADVSPLSGVKRPRVTVDKHHPLVHVVYDSLPRASIQRLEELLQQWSQWHSQKCSSSDTRDSDITLESGEKTYFPALCISSDKPSAITFWIDNQSKIQASKDFKPLDDGSVPRYDRGYASALASVDSSSKLDGAVEKLHASQCFNCGSYSHALKDCPKPRDNIAVNNARKQHKSQQNKRPNSRNLIRYYQSSRGGKYDDLVPGMLNVETRQALDLGELDPPPWLNRMREIGYPPGYLDVDDQPSGITIFGDEENKKDGVEEIIGSCLAKPCREMTVKFPGINAPIPENADKRVWETASTTPFQSRDNSHPRVSTHSSENPSRWRHTEQRWYRDFDDGPPGCDPGMSPSLSKRFPSYGDHEYGDYSLTPRASPYGPYSSSYSRSFSENSRRSPLRRDPSTPYPRYHDHDYGYSFPKYDDNDYGHSSFSPSTSWSSSFGRSLPDRGGWSPLARDGSPSYGRYGMYPYSSPR